MSFQVSAPGLLVHSGFSEKEDLEDTWNPSERPELFISGLIETPAGT